MSLAIAKKYEQDGEFTKMREEYFKLHLDGDKSALYELGNIYFKAASDLMTAFSDMVEREDIIGNKDDFNAISDTVTILINSNLRNMKQAYEYAHSAGNSNASYMLGIYGALMATYNKKTPIEARIDQVAALQHLESSARSGNKKAAKYVSKYYFEESNISKSIEFMSLCSDIPVTEENIQSLTDEYSIYDYHGDLCHLVMYINSDIPRKRF
jgi:TPR repeat protein